ncbi:hypothetical protein PV328_011590 [Microctonus aethiopoides]|uniref:G kinase-anchoring protein 1 n=1 Tax=Microctonus aethiopoides TaxID=144406 RepID=A0AA39F0F3_9HYME|nr:hypothetical protein PV328_011590 [Microctonus aethiopoides]
MATAVPSRFAVLAIDDDECKPKKNQKSSTFIKQQPKNKNNKLKDQQIQQQHQANKDEKKKPNKNKKKKGCNENQQWEQWKEKDSLAIEEAYQHELHQAVLLSKLAYESQLDNGIVNKNQDGSKKIIGNNKKTKKSTMSLEEFNNMVAPNDSSQQTSVIGYENKSDAEFFVRLDKEAKEEIIKNKEKDMLKSRLNTLDDDITLAQLKVEIEHRDEEIQELKDELLTLKKELSQVKERNKKLYQILSHGEMKDKASVLAEVAKLQEIRDELTSEVTSLHAQLEQERSKTRISSTDNIKSSKQTNKKRPASENV